MASSHPKQYEVTVLSLNALQKIEKIATDSFAMMQTVTLSIDKSNVISKDYIDNIIKKIFLLSRL